MIWNLTGQGKSLPKEASFPCLSFTLLFPVVQATPQPSGWRWARDTSAPVPCAQCACSGEVRAWPPWLLVVLPPRIMPDSCFSFPPKAFAVVSLPFVPLLAGPILKTSSGNSEASLVFRGLLGLCIFCGLTSLLAAGTSWEASSVPGSTGWLHPPVLGNCHKGAYVFFLKHSFKNIHLVFRSCKENIFPVIFVTFFL